MKIVYCLEGIHYPGGTERTVINKANYLSACGFEVYVITSEDNGRQPAFLLSNQVKHYDLGTNFYTHWSRSFFKRLYYHFRNRIVYKRALLSLLKTIKPDIVISTFNREVFILSRYKGLKVLKYHYSRPTFDKFHRSTISGFYDKWLHKKYLNAIKRYDRFVVLTKEDAENWKDFNNVLSIPNAKSFKCAQPARLDNPKVLAVGRLTEQKGFDKLIDAWNIVSKNIDGWTLSIVGDGPLKDDLQKQIDELGLSKSVFLKGKTSDIMKEYLDVSIVAVSSLYEGFGLAILEAMSCGIPVVSFACPCGPRDMIESGENGFLIPKDDVETLADKLVYLMRHPEERKEMGKNAYESSNNFSQEKVMKQWINLFEGLYNGK